ncbi:hypothetical protein C8Q75DRAFT_810388 [Abortiporus biennis]|nr:hypothetical protein C8Q75DRAFT_810388 [Abortiporus biennis]
MDRNSQCPYRWSEVVPPHTALSFAAIWDPQEGIITFTGPRLLESVPDSPPPLPPKHPYPSSSLLNSSYRCHDFPEEASRSQVSTFDMLGSALMGNTPTEDEGRNFRSVRRRTVTFACYNTQALDESGSVLDPFFRPRFRYIIEQGDADCVEEVEDGVGYTKEVYEEQDDHESNGGTGDGGKWKEIARHLIAAARTPLDGKRLFGMNFGSGSGRDDVDREYEEEEEERARARARATARAREDDSGFFEEEPLTATRGSYYSAPILVNLNLKSAFSVTTTSTTNYVTVDRPSVCQSGHHHYSRYDSDGTTVHQSDIWSTLRDLNTTPGPHTPHISSPLALNNGIRRVLRKPRPCRSCSSDSHDQPASPSEVLAREEYNHEVSPQSSPSVYSQFSLLSSPVDSTHSGRVVKQKTSSLSLAKAKAKDKMSTLLDRLAKCCKELTHPGGSDDEDDDERWVDIDGIQYGAGWRRYDY